MNATAVSPDKLHSSRESELGLVLTASRWSYIICNVKWYLADCDCGWFNGRATLGCAGLSLVYKTGWFMLMLKPSHKLWCICSGTALQIMATGRVSWKTHFVLNLAVHLAHATVMLGWVQIQLDLTNVQKLSFFQATLRSFPDGKSQMRLYHDHRVLPPAQPGPKDVTQQSFHQARCFVLEPEHFFQKYTQASVKWWRIHLPCLSKIKRGESLLFRPNGNPHMTSNRPVWSQGETYVNVIQSNLHLCVQASFKCWSGLQDISS